MKDNYVHMKDDDIYMQVIYVCMQDNYVYTQDDYVYIITNYYFHTSQNLSIAMKNIMQWYPFMATVETCCFILKI